MATNKRITNLVDYTAVLPYASEIFGVYMPLLGWKSKRMKQRFEKGLNNDKNELLALLQQQFSGEFEVQYAEDCRIQIHKLAPGKLSTGKLKSFDSIVLLAIASRLPAYDRYEDSVWHELLSDGSFDSIFKKHVIEQYTEFYLNACKGNFANVNLGHIRERHGADDIRALVTGSLEKQLKYESAMAGSLQYLFRNKNFAALKNVFYSVNNNEAMADAIVQALSSDSSQDAYLNINNLDPQDKEHIANVALSPISVVHLFRQYFFELDTFLGTPVGHVWLSPGSSVELVEVSTRKSIVEKTIETTLETITKSETSTTDQEEISDAVKEDNKRDIKFGASVEVSYSSVTASTSFDLDDSQQKSREQNHKRMRQQTEKLSSEIRKNVKSTFKTVTETTDTSSKRYVLANTTGNLINYEMRRKMRQVGVQVQDIGTYLCWQTYVDDPGKDLGLAKLIHIARSPDTDTIPEADLIPNPEMIESRHPFTIPFITTDGADKDEAFASGNEVDKELGEWDGDHITFQFDVSGILPPKSDYEYDSHTIDYHGQTLAVSILNPPWPAGAPPYRFRINLDQVNFQGKDNINIDFVFKWKPSKTILDLIAKKNQENTATRNAKIEQEFKKAYLEDVKERVKLASKIQPRPSEDLREEERIVIYRRLIQDMLSNGISMPDDRTRHVVAELINSIFDVDKMLYFVAPEWWRPRLHQSSQQFDTNVKKPLNKVKATAANALSTVVSNVLGVVGQTASAAASPATLASNVVGWGEVDSGSRDNYYITEESEPAKLGSSLGWLLQLDGDNMRNAFLNAPWVKAVMPIRPGREEAAINWLKGVEGFNGIGEDDIYQSNNANEVDLTGKPYNGQRLIDVLMDLAKKIEKKHREGIESKEFPKKADVANPELVDADNVVTSSPIDRVYEHGFYALKNGFKANVSDSYEIFDQWIEILPTDQVVPVEVKYDPKTGRQQ